MPYYRPIICSNSNYYMYILITVVARRFVFHVVGKTSMKDCTDAGISKGFRTRDSVS